MKSYSTQKVYELLYSWYQTTWLFLTFKMIIINKKKKDHRSELQFHNS